MAKLFKENAVTAEQLISYKEFAPFIDLKNKEFIPEKMEKVIKQAEEKLEKPIPFLPLSVFLEYRDNGNRTHFQDPYFERRVMAMTLAFAEAYEKKGRFIQKLADVVWAIMEESTWMIHAHMYNSPIGGDLGVPHVYRNDQIHGIDLFSASTAGVMTMVYMLLKDELDKISTVICEKMLYMLEDRIVRPYLNCVFWWTGEKGNAINNWCPWIHSNILFVTAITVKDDYIRKAIVTKSLAALDNFTNEYKPDGGCTEGPSYWGAAGASYFDCLEILYDMSGGKINIYGDPLVKAMLEYIVKFNINARHFINFADCAPTAHHDGIMLRRMGEKVGSDSLAAFGDTMAMIADGSCGYGQFNHIYRAIKNFYAKTPATCDNKAETKIWFPDLKVMAAREGSDPSKGIFVAMKGGTNGEQHNHNDVGNVVVYYDGKPVFIDTGAGTYTKATFSNLRYTLWFMQSNYHNLPAFGGVAEMQGGRFASRDEEYNEETGGVKMELSGAYPQDAGLVSYKRSTLLDENKVVNITDEFELNEEKEVDFRFMTCAKPEIIGEGTLSLVHGRTMTFDPRLACEIEEFSVNDDGIKSKWKSDVLWRIHLRINSKKDKFVFKVR